jgi:hypothetical protein
MMQKRGKPPLELLDLSILGGAVERRYRNFRPEIEQLPWGTLAAYPFDPELRARARDYWMRVCLNEYQSAGGVAQTLATFITAQVPIDLTSVLSRFVLEEISHAEMAARLVGELGDGPAVEYAPPDALLEPPSDSWRPLVRAAYYMMRGFCTGEALSLAIVRATAKTQSHPLVDGVMRRIAKDEAAHGAFGWIFFDWAMERFTQKELTFIRKQAKIGVRNVREIIAACEDNDEPTLGWLHPSVMRKTCEHALQNEIVAPLRERDLL